MLEIMNDSTHQFERDGLFKKWGQFNVLKRTIRHPKTEVKFDKAVFKQIE